MATKNLALYGYEEDDYIDMELISSPQSTEFEFTCTNAKDSITSPADELFYNGKLLPLLHLPPAAAAASTFHLSKEALLKEEDDDDIYYTMPLPKCSTAPCTNTANTPLDSANISPSESCRVSCELNPDDYFFQWSTELTGFINSHSTKRSGNWSKKLKLIKHTLIGHKLRASRAYLKSLFSKSACSDESCAKANCNAGGGDSLPGDAADEESAAEKYLKVSRKLPFRGLGRASHPTIGAIMKGGGDQERIQDDNNSGHRRSFSSTIKRHSPNKCLSSSSSNSSSGASSSSSSFSLNSNGLPELQVPRRRSSATEIENSIEAAIAHCKKSQHNIDSRNSSSEPGICSISADL